MNDYDFSSEILKTEEFNLLRKLQQCSLNVVHENEQVLVNGMFYNYNDLSDEMKEYREKHKKDFMQSISNIICERYPSLNKEQIDQIAIRCSAHTKENQSDVLLDIDICALQFFETNELNENIKNCLENIRVSSSQIHNIGFDVETYSEEYAKYFLLSQLNKHMQNINEPLLTWGESRLVAEMNTELVKQKNSTITF